MERVLIAGCPGAGKSTAARKLASITGLPLIHLDRHYWLPGWVRPDSEAWRMTVEGLVTRPRWIMDGNYSGTLGIRLRAADTLIYLDFSTALCAARVAWRTLGGFGRPRRDELDTTCPERLDWPFFSFVLRYRRGYRARDMAKMAGFQGAMHVFTSPGQLAAFLSALGKD